MMKTNLLLYAFLTLTIMVSCSKDEDKPTPPTLNTDTSVATNTDDIGKDWEGIPVPADAGDGKTWELQTDISDDFNYSFNSTAADATFGDKWTNFYHSNWEGPGPTKWVRQNVSVNNGNLNLKASREDGEMKSFNIDCDLDGIAETITLPTTRGGCITSTRRVIFPVYVETKVKVTNAVIASDVWLLSPDDTQEIDIIEAYGGPGDDNRNQWFSERIHLSHHTFIRNPFTDYQPTDTGTWWRDSATSKWGNEWVTIGIYWKSPKHLEYYINGQAVRILSDNAFASRDANSSWTYSYPRPVVNGSLPLNGSGSQAVNLTTSLENAMAQSSTSVIDPLNHLNNGMNLDKEMDIIINIEDQSWNACNGRTPTNLEIQDEANNTFNVDWIRIYKPI